MFDFPNNPTTNQVVLGTRGEAYVWDGWKWVAGTGPTPPPGALYLPISGGALSGPLYIDGTLNLWGDSASVNNFDAQIWATGGATTSSNPGQGELNLLAGRHIFQGYDGTTQFRISNTPWSWVWWEALGGSQGTAATLRAGSDLTPDANGVIAAQGHGSLTLGNGEGTLLSLPSVGGPIINYLRVTNGQTNQGVTLGIAGGDGLRVNLGLVTSYNGSVVTGNANGPMGVFADPTTTGVPRTSWFNFVPGASGFVPTIGLSGATNETLAITASGTGRIWFQKGVSFGAATAASPTDVTTHIDLYNGTYGISVQSNLVNFVAPSAAAHTFYYGPGSIGYVNNTGLNMPVGQQSPNVGIFTTARVGSLTGPTIRGGAGAPTGTQPNGSIWLRSDGVAGAHLYVTDGSGGWLPVAGV